MFRMYSLFSEQLQHFLVKGLVEVPFIRAAFQNWIPFDERQNKLLVEVLDLRRERSEPPFSIPNLPVKTSKESILRSVARYSQVVTDPSKLVRAAGSQIRDRLLRKIVRWHGDVL